MPEQVTTAEKIIQALTINFCGEIIESALNKFGSSEGEERRDQKIIAFDTFVEQADKRPSGSKTER